MYVRIYIHTVCGRPVFMCCTCPIFCLAPPPPSKKDRPPVMPKTLSKQDLASVDHPNGNTSTENGACSGRGQGVVGRVKV